MGIYITALSQLFHQTLFYKKINHRLCCLIKSNLIYDHIIGGQVLSLKKLGDNIEAYKCCTPSHKTSPN